MNNIDFEQLKQKIIPYFISIYGSEYENLITERINKIVPLFYSTIKGKQTEMYDKKREKELELTIKFLDHLNIEIPQELKEEAIRENSIYKIQNFENVKKILEFYFGMSKCYSANPYNGVTTINLKQTDNINIIKANISKLSLLGINVSEENYNEWILSEEAIQLNNNIEQVKTYISTLDKEYNEFDNQFVELKTTIDKCSSIKRNLQEKYLIEFLSSIKKYMTEQDKTKFENYLNSDKKYSYQLNELEILEVVGRNFDNNGLIDYFSSNSIERINDPNTSKFVKNSIIEQRVKYYKLLGIYNEQMTPEEFINSEIALKNTPPQYFMDEIISKKQYYSNLFEKEVLETTSTYMENIYTVNSLNLDNQPQEIYDIISNGTNCIIPCTKIINNEPEAIPLLCFSQESGISQYVDVSFIHEINHAVELSLIEHTEEENIYKTGFEYVADINEGERNYEMFSEVINQLIAIQVTEEMHNDGAYLFNNSKNAKTRGGVSYEHQNIFIIEFWNQFRPYIIKSRVENNMSSLFNIVGEENFKKLNEIINEYVNLPYYKLMDDVIAGRETELTEKRKKLLLMKDEIIASMIEYSNNYGQIGQQGYVM